MLTTSYAGLQLRNPIIAASSSKTNNAKHNKDLDDAGVGAIVLKSLFEENIIHAECEMMKNEQHTEAADYLSAYLRTHELNEYIALIKESKRVCSVPIIASINAVNAGEWTSFAKLIEQAGADALEINIMGIECNVNYTYGDVEERHINILKAVKSVINIPVIVKLGSMLSNPIALIDKLKAHGAAAVVLFNRMYQSDINIDKIEYVSANTLSSAADLLLPLRWVAIASNNVKGIDIAHSGGIQTANDLIKAILAGATAVQVCSTLYKNGNNWITDTLKQIQQWQNKQGYLNINDYRGKLTATDENQELLMRTQFLRTFGGM